MDPTRAKYTFLTVIGAFAVLLTTLAVAAYVFTGRDTAAENIVAVLGAVTGVLGTLTGYIAGQAGKSEAEDRASKAEQKLAAVLDASDQGVLGAAKTAYPKLFE